MSDASTWRIVVAPDPVLNVPGPVFEIDPLLRLLRRENGDAPPFVVWRGLALVSSYRDCLMNGATTSESAASEGQETTEAPMSKPQGCPNVNVEGQTRTFEGLLQLTL